MAASSVPYDFAILSDLHVAPYGTADARWNNPMRLSRSRELLKAAAAEVAAGGYKRVVVLGDLSDDGAAESIDFALETFAHAKLSAWIVPGNHDVIASPNVLQTVLPRYLTTAAMPRPASVEGEGLCFVGHGLISHDRGKTCAATDLVGALDWNPRILVWVGHYPVISQEMRVKALGLRYPGDLVNLSQVTAKLEEFKCPILALHGHLHLSVVSLSGRLLQIGVPAVVEWPHAWVAASLRIADDRVTIAARLRQISGGWSDPPYVETIIDKLDQTWTYSGGHW